MMRLTLAALLSFTCTVNALDSQECKCHAPEPDATTRTGYFEDITVGDEIPHKALSGVAHLSAADEPLEGVLVELFTAPERLSEKSRRVKVCVTEADGKFCFTGIPKGRYELRASKEGGFEITHMKVIVDPKNPQSTDKEIDVTIEPGK